MKYRRTVLLALVVALSPVPHAHAKPGCGGAFRKSCLKALYSCFNAKGACVTQTQQPTYTFDPTTGMIHFTGPSKTSTCWANHAKSVISIDPNTGTGTLVATTSRGKACLSGTIGAGGAITYTRKRKTWKLLSAQDGSLTVTCPNGKTETYTAAQLTAASPKCGGRGAVTCTPGTCS